MKTKQPVIIDAVRTAVGRRDGIFKDVRPDDLSGTTLNALVQRNGIQPCDVEDIVIGCVTQKGEQGGNIGRLVPLVSGFPVTTAGTTVNRMCASGLQAVVNAAQQVATDMVDVVIGGGVESMTREAMGTDMGQLNEKLMSNYEIVWQGESAERIADQWEISREELDQFALNSHEKAANAQDNCHFSKEIIPVEVNGQTVDQDEGIRRGSTMETLGSLAPSFRPDGKITAANSSQISDGAAAVLITSEEKANEMGLKPKAKFRSWAVAGVDPTIMLTGPIPSTHKVLEKAGLTLPDIDLVEINEAFASVVLAWGREFDPDWDKVNVNGGAIALGHPLGATGARLTATLLNEMERRDVALGLITICIGFGQGLAAVIERV
jgi:acetyl-CoA acetyltransferase family protein